MNDLWIKRNKTTEDAIKIYNGSLITLPTGTKTTIITFEANLPIIQNLGRFGNLGIGIGIGIAKKNFFLAKFLFLPFEVSYEENIYGEVLFKYPCTPSWEFQPLFRVVILKKPVSTCFWRKELHSRRYLRSFKNTHGWKLHSAHL